MPYRIDKGESHRLIEVISRFFAAYHLYKTQTKWLIDTISGQNRCPCAVALRFILNPLNATAASPRRETTLGSIFVRSDR